MAKQSEFNLWCGKRGGRRPGCGRKRKRHAGVAHRARERVGSRTPLHINFKLRASLRNKACLRILKRAILRARLQGLRIAHYSLQSNHVHLIVEAPDNAGLTRGMRALTVTFSKGVGKGKVQLERYCLHVLKGVRETKNAVRYVLLNHVHHTGTKIAALDGYSSLLTLPREGLRLFLETEKLKGLFHGGSPLRMDPPLSWLLRQGASQLTA